MPSNSDWPLRTQYLTGLQGLHDRSAPPQPVFRTDDRGTLLIYVPCCFCLNVILIKLHRRMFQLASQHIRWRQGLRTPMLGCTQVVINPCPVGGPFPSNRSLTFFSFPSPLLSLSLPEHSRGEIFRIYICTACYFWSTLQRPTVIETALVRPWSRGLLFMYTPGVTARLIQESDMPQDGVSSGFDYLVQ